MKSQLMKRSFLRLKWFFVLAPIIYLVVYLLVKESDAYAEAISYIEHSEEARLKYGSIEKTILIRMILNIARADTVEPQGLEYMYLEVWAAAKFNYF